MPIETPPRIPLPVNFKPADGTPFLVGGYLGGKPTDTWETAAAAHRMDVKKLIHFNFHTNNSNEVNYYLRRNVGCRVPSRSGLNWTFERANPGIIYIPTRTIDVGVDDSHEVTGDPGSKTDWKKKGDEINAMYSTGGWQLLGKIFDIVSAADTAIAVAEIGVPAALGAFSAVGMPALGFLASMMALGMPHMEAIDKTKQDQALWGLSYGLLLGADKKSKDFIQSHRFDRRPVNNPVYPEQERNFQAAYQMGLATGYAGGKKMNSAQKKQLFLAVYKYMDLDVFPDNLAQWSHSDWHNYYIKAAAAFRGKILKL